MSKSEYEKDVSGKNILAFTSFKILYLTNIFLKV